MRSNPFSMLVGYASGSREITLPQVAPRAWATLNTETFHHMGPIYTRYFHQIKMNEFYILKSIAIFSPGSAIFLWFVFVSVDRKFLRINMVDAGDCS